MGIMKHLSLVLTTLASAQVTFQNSSGTILRVDNGTYGPPIEEYHYYYNQWPIGLAVSSTERLFVCYTRGTYEYTLGEAINKTAEVPYPPGLNLGPSQLNTTLGGISFASNNSTGFISVQALYISPTSSVRPETLWVLDTGRPTIIDAQGVPSMSYAQPGGPKIIAISLTNNSVYATYTFPPNVHYPDSYMNDLRYDLRSNVSFGGQGIMYIVDSSDEGRNGFIMLDLGTGKSWRRLTEHPSTLRVNNDVPSYQNLGPFYIKEVGMPINHIAEGIDGVQISADGETMYYSPLTSNYLYSVPTSVLLVNDTDSLAEQRAHNSVTNLGQRGGNANGFEGDSNGLIYQLMPEHNGVNYYDPKTYQAYLSVRDPRIIWPDSASIGEDGYFYVNINQLPYQPLWNNGTDLRVHPGAVLRWKLPNNGSKIMGLTGP